MKKKIMTMAMMALAFTACTEEDLMQPSQGDAGTLHITSVTIDGQEVARSRVAADGGTYAMDELPYNQSITGFTEGDWLMIYWGFKNEDLKPVHATLKNGTWLLTDSDEKPVTIQPGDGEKWADAYMESSFFRESSRDKDKARRLGAVPFEIEIGGDILLCADCLSANTDKSQQETYGWGSITIDTDLKSPTLGAVKIALKHDGCALLRLPMSAVSVKNDTYIVGGKAHNVTGLATLWAEVRNKMHEGSKDYTPLTKVTIKGSDYLQAIVNASTDDIYTLTGFKAVLTTQESGTVGSDSFDETKTVTLDLPFTATVEGASANTIALLPNYQYPLTLNIEPHTASVSLSGGLGKPGWGTDEEELSNEQNEKALEEVTYDASTSTFSVSGATGLRLVALYMNGEVTAGSIDGWPTTDLLKQNITLTADITFPEVGEGESNWTPIAMSTIENGDGSDYYQGTIDGGGHTITGMTVNSSEQDMSKRFGLVGHLYITGVVKNLTFKDCTIHGYYGTGLAVGYNYSGLVSNCHAAADCTVTAASYYAGGIVGSNDGRIVNCTSAATVTANTDAGGITGSTSSSGIIAACSATGHVSVTDTGNTPGGLVGEHYGKMYGCWSTATTGTGDAVTTLDVVGTVGSNKVISSCYTTATTATYGANVTAEALNTVTDTATDDDPIELMNAAIATYNSNINDSDAYKKSSKHWASGTTLPVLVDISSTSGE